jgi:hypothetical protein
MADAAVLNRCVWDVTGMAREKTVGVGDNMHGGRVVRVPTADSISGYRWIGSGLAPIDCLPCSGFEDYITSWEQRYSALIPNRTSSLTLAPVVSDKSLSTFNSFPFDTWSAFPVTAYKGTVSVDDIIVLRKFATSKDGSDRRKALEWLLDQGTEAYVAHGYPDAGDWGPFSDKQHRAE